MSSKSRNAVLDGIRTFAGAEIVFLHTLVLWSVWWREDLFDRYTQRSPLAMLVVTFSHSGVDLFFLLASVLLSCKTIDHLKSTGGAFPPIGKWFGERLIRICPLFWLHIVSNWLVSSGPRRWSLPFTLAFVDNYVPMELRLGGLSWSISADMQCHLFIPIVIWAAYRAAKGHPRAVLGRLCWALLIAVSLRVWVALANVDNDIPAYTSTHIRGYSSAEEIEQMRAQSHVKLFAWETFSQPPSPTGQYGRELYFWTHARLSTWVIGAIVALIYRERSAIMEEESSSARPTPSFAAQCLRVVAKSDVVLLLSVAAVMGRALVPHTIPNPTLRKLYLALYLVLSAVAMGVAFLQLLLPSYGGMIAAVTRSFLSHSMWRTTADLTYATILFHPLVIAGLSLSFPPNYEATLVEAPTLKAFAGLATAAYILSLTVGKILCVVVEAPAQRLWCKARARITGAKAKEV